MNLFWTFGRTPWTGDQPDARPLPTQDNTRQHNTAQHRKTPTHIHASSGIRTRDPNVRAAEDSACSRPRGHWDLLRWLPLIIIFMPPPPLLLTDLTKWRVWSTSGNRLNETSRPTLTLLYRSVKKIAYFKTFPKIWTHITFSSVFVTENVSNQVKLSQARV
jgi:hypothetical protein